MKKKIYRLSFDGQVNASLNNMFPYYIFEMKETVDAGKLQKAAWDEPVEMPLSMFETENSKVEYYRFVFQKEDIKEIAENTETSNFAMLSGMVAKAQKNNDLLNICPFILRIAKVLEEEGVSYKMENLKLHAPIHHKSERLYK